jgi:ASPIC/UnbV protein/VCBS repeat protein
MVETRQNRKTRPEVRVRIAITVVAMIIILRIANHFMESAARSPGGRAREASHSKSLGRPPVGSAAPIRPDGLKPRIDIDPSGFSPMVASIPPWDPAASLVTIAESWRQPGLNAIARLERARKTVGIPRDPLESVSLLVIESTLFSSEGNLRRSYELLEEARSLVQKEDRLARDWLYTIIYLEGVAALRRGENDNCIDCRGESSCILPIAPAAVHSNPTGSRLAIRHFTEYLEKFPDDLEVRWLLNLAHMTLGEHPEGVDSRYRIALDRFRKSEFDIGKFRDIGHLTGVNRFNQAGGAIMEDFDGDGLLDLVVSSLDPTEALGVYRNKGNGVFEERGQAAGVTRQFGGLYCVQTDYNNDGRMDVYIPRGAWLSVPIRPSLLRNDGGGTFTDVTEEAGLLDPVNSNSAAWADYDNDGWLDLFVCCERQPNRLYHNRGNGTFEAVSIRGTLGNPNRPRMCKGAAWIDIDNDDYPDLFLNNMGGASELFRNNRNGTFQDVTEQMGIDGPSYGFSCWAWDYDNDGWLDIFATCYDRSLADVVKGLTGQPHSRYSNRLFRNLKGRGFENKTKEAGLDMVFATMGSNFGDFDNDGLLDMYLGTGDPSFSMLIPNRMFKNVDGRRFAEITGTSGTGHLQKGHGVACGDWDRDGDVDLFVQTGGAVNGDKYHNILFQNPGQGNHWLTVKLAGKQTNRAAIGARIKVVTAGAKPLTIYRHVSSGSSFGANPLQQTIGLARAERVATLEIHWPTSGTTQVFRDVAVDQAIEINEFAESYRPLGWKPIPQPE